LGLVNKSAQNWEIVDAEQVAEVAFEANCFDQ
jgi:hypothetical protein